MMKAMNKRMKRDTRMGKMKRLKGKENMMDSRTTCMEQMLMEDTSCLVRMQRRMIQDKMSVKDDDFGSIILSDRIPGEKGERSKERRSDYKLFIAIQDRWLNDSLYRGSSTMIMSACDLKRRTQHSKTETSSSIVVEIKDVDTYLRERSIRGIKRSWSQSCSYSWIAVCRRVWSDCRE